MRHAPILPRQHLLLFLLLTAAMLPAQTAMQAALLVTAQPNTSPAEIIFSWPLDNTATGYVARRRNVGATGWTVVSVPGGGTATAWVDTAAVVGERYEYWFQKNGTPAARGFLTAGIEADMIEDRGILILIVDDTKTAALGTRLDRLIEDLVGDGWTVLRHDVAPTDTPPNVKALIQADVAANPGRVQSVFLLGHVPVPYSGQINPDGHPDHLGAWPADLYYGELNGNWTDTMVNNTSATRAANRNVPGDGKFDQSSIPNDVELAVGRVDLVDMPAFGVGEDVLLQQYLDKDHDYRHKVFAVEQRAVIDDNFGWFSGEAFAASGWRNFAGLVGPANTSGGDYFTTLNTTSGNGYAWSYGCGSGYYQGASGIGDTNQFAASTNRNVFTMLFGSYFGDWDNTNNFLRAPLCSGWTLTNVWAGRPHWSFHPMGMGETIGYATRFSQNDTSAGGFFLRYVHLALMGDPSLRQHVIAPASNVVVTEIAGTANVAWNAPPEAVAGYHVYRSPTAAGPFTRLTAAAVTGSPFVDTTPLPGFATYMVRASRLEVSPSGSYWNLSQGSFAATCLPQTTAAHVTYGAGCYAPNALQLTASPAPISTPATGTLVTYAIDNIPEASPQSGVHFGITIVSLTPDLAGSSLASLGLPGCDLYVGSLDVTLAFSSAMPSATATFEVPAEVACGTSFFATAVALVMPGSLPNGQNAFGAVTSNGVASTVAPN